MPRSAQVKDLSGGAQGSLALAARDGRTGRIVVEKASSRLGLTKGQLAETVGLRADSLQRADRANAAKSQARMAEMLEIVSRVAKWSGGEKQALAWYRSEPIPAFADRTAESLVKEGRAAAVRDWLDAAALGGYA